jgi:hypothetical protein
MRKITLIVALVSFAMASQAQIFVGGSLGFNTQGGKYKPKSGSDYKFDRTTAFEIAPMVGYQLDEKLAAGLRINFASVKETEFSNGSDKDYIYKDPVFGAELFGQYTFYTQGKFSVYAEAGIGFSSSKPKSGFEGNLEGYYRYSTFGLNIKPVLAYNLNDKITLLCNLNFMGFGFNSMTRKDDDGNKQTNNAFGLNVNTNKLVKVGADIDLTTTPWDPIIYTGHISIGFIYKL